MKTIAYYYDGYEDKPIWLDESVASLENYYHRYDIEICNMSYKNNSSIKKYLDLRGYNWWGMMSSRILYMSEFLKTDYDMMIVTDLDYIVLRPHINIRDHLKSDVVFPHTWKPSKQLFEKDKIKHCHGLNKIMLTEMAIPESLHQYTDATADFFAFSRQGCENFIDFFNSIGWDVSTPEGLAEIHKLTTEKVEHGGISDETFFTAYLTYLNSHDVNVLFDFEDSRKAISSTTWGNTNLTLTLKDLWSKNHIFHHFGSITKQNSKEFLRLLQLFKRD